MKTNMRNRLVFWFPIHWWLFYFKTLLFLCKGDSSLKKIIISIQNNFYYLNLINETESFSFIRWSYKLKSSIPKIIWWICPLLIRFFFFTCKDKQKQKKELNTINKFLEKIIFMVLNPTFVKKKKNLKYLGGKMGLDLSKYLPENLPKEFTYGTSDKHFSLFNTISRKETILAETIVELQKILIRNKKIDLENLSTENFIRKKFSQALNHKIYTISSGYRLWDFRLTIALYDFSGGPPQYFPYGLHFLYDKETELINTLIKKETELLNKLKKEFNL